jgi:hypothetical protein
VLCSRASEVACRAADRSRFRSSAARPPAEQLRRRGLSEANPDARVFVGQGGKALGYAIFRSRDWLLAPRRAGLTGLTFHDLRRVNAAGMVIEGVDLRTAQTRLGRSDPRLTLAIYAQATTEADQEAARRLGARFMPSRGSLTREGRAMRVSARRTARRQPPLSRTTLVALRGWSSNLRVGPSTRDDEA